MTEILSEAEIDHLFGIVQSMARFLGPETSLADVAKRFRDVHDDKSRSRVLIPSQDVLDAMLVGHEQSLLEMRGTSSVWRTSLPTDRSDADLRQIAHAMTPDVDFIFAFEQGLSGVLRHDQDETFEFLAEQLRILPTTPSTAQMRDALSNHALAKKAMGHVDSLAVDAENLAQYHRMLVENAGNLARAIALGAFFGGLHSGDASALAMPPDVTVKPRVDAVRTGLRILADALRFVRLDARAIDVELRRLEADLGHVRRWGPLVPIVLTDPSAMRDRLAAWSASAYRRGVEARLDGFDDASTDSAWREWQRRYLVYVRSRRDVSLELHELVKVAVGSLERGRIGMRFEQATLHDWSVLLFQADGSYGHDAVPRWVSLVALEELGFANLARAVRTVIADEFAATLDDASLSPALRDELAARTPGSSSDVCLVVTRSTGSLTEEWMPGVPTRGFCIVLTAREAIDFAHRLRRMSRTERVRSTVCQEVPDDADGESVSFPAQELRGKRVRELWFGRGAVSAKRAEPVLTPGSFDELIDLASESHGPPAAT